MSQDYTTALQPDDRVRLCLKKKKNEMTASDQCHLLKLHVEIAEKQTHTYMVTKLMMKLTLKYSGEMTDFSVKGAGSTGYSYGKNK